MTHDGPPGHGGLPGRSPRGGTSALTWILSAIGIAFGIVFAVGGLAVVGFVVWAVVGMNSYGSNK